jgi:hypothetical protein
MVSINLHSVDDSDVDVERALGRTEDEVAQGGILYASPAADSVQTLHPLALCTRIERPALIAVTFVPPFRVHLPHRATRGNFLLLSGCESRVPSPRCGLHPLRRDRKDRWHRQFRIL